MLLEFSVVISSSSLLLYLKIQSNWQRLWDLQLGLEMSFQNYLHLEKPLLNLSPMENQELGAWTLFVLHMEWTAKGCATM